MINQIFAHYDPTFRTMKCYDTFTIYYTNGASRTKSWRDHLTHKEMSFIAESVNKQNIIKTFSGVLYMHAPIRAQISGRMRSEENLIKEKYGRRLKKHGYKTRCYTWNGHATTYYYRSDDQEERRINYETRCNADKRAKRV